MASAGVTATETAAAAATAAAARRRIDMRGHYDARASVDHGRQADRDGRAGRAAVVAWTARRAGRTRSGHPAGPRDVQMEISLGGCHYGIDDTATMTGVRPGRSGWIAVCDRHRDQAEAAGFVLRAVAV